MKKSILLALGFAMLSASVYAQPATTAAAFRMYNTPASNVTIRASLGAGTGTFFWPQPAVGIFKSDIVGNMSLSAVNLNSGDVTNVLPVGNGGTGVSNIPTNSLILGNGTGPVTLLAPVANRMLATDGTGTPSWQAFPPPGFTVPFNMITTGVNTQPATMTLGNGSTLTFSGTGIVNANQFNMAAGTNAVDLATTEVNGVLPIANGGTNQSGAAVNGAVIWSDANSYEYTAVGAVGQTLRSNGAAAPTWVSGSALTDVDDANITLTLGGTPASALLQPVSITAGWSGLLSLARGGTNSPNAASAGSVAYSDANSFEWTAVGSANQVLISNGAAAPSWSNVNSVITGSALTESDDVNLVVTLTGTPATALLQPVNIDVDWAGLLSLARGGTNKNAAPSAGSVAYSDADSYEWTAVGAANQVLISNGAGAPSWSNVNAVVTGSALTESDDANVQLTLTGTPATALLQGVNIAAGWSGQLSIARGGTNGTAAPTAGAVSYGTGSAYAFSTAGTSGQFLTSGGAGAPTWSTGSIALAKGYQAGDAVNYSYTVAPGVNLTASSRIFITFQNAGPGGLQTTYSIVDIDAVNDDFTVEFANIISASEGFHWVVF